MRTLSTIKRFVRRGALFAAVTGVAVGVGLFTANALNNSQASAASSSCPGFNGDTNAVIWCGADSNGTAKASEITARYNNGDGHNSAASIHNIYGSNVFNITSADIQNLSSTAKVGSVTKGGDVMLNGKVVATNALTAGRQNIAGSTKHVNNGTVFYTRPPKVSFLNDSLSAYVVMVNGQFKFAVLLSCGNPVSATPKTPPTPKVPKYTINKLVAPKGSGNFQKSVKVQSGAHVVYQVTVDSTGNAPVTNLKVNDKLPQNVAYVPGTLMEDGKAVDASQFFAGGVTVGTLNPGAKTVFTFEAVVGDKDTVDTCQAETLVNEADMTASQLPGENSSASVSKTCAPKPVFACTSLTPFQKSRDEFTFTANATAKNGATIDGYTFDFGDNSNKPVNTAAETTSVPHTYADAGTFNVTVSVKINVNGTTKTVTAPACATTVTVTPPPASAECTDLELTQDAGNPRLVTANAHFTTKNGATLTGSSFDWGDGSTTPSSTATANHTYQSDDTFTVKATLSFSADSGKVPDSSCQAKVTVTTVMPTCNQLSIDINNDTKVVTVSSLTFTPNNGTYQSTSLDWGDGTTPASFSDITGQQHTYAADGPFTVVATPHFLVNGVDTPITSQSCQQPVHFTETPTPPPTTPPQTPPTQLVNTGVGSVAGLFGAAVIAGIFGYRRLLSRRLSRTAADPTQL